MDKGQVLNRVYESSLPSRAKTVMFYLINRSNKELTCFPAIPTIARETGLSERTVQRALKELVEEGFVEKTPRYRENGGQSSNLYRLGIEKDDCSVEPAIQDDELENASGNETEEKTQERIDSKKGKRLQSDANVQIENLSVKYQITDFYSLYSIPIIQHTCHREGDRYVPP